jgi:serine/threonine-protein kinase
MAPEYIRTGNPDPRNDLFAVGVMLYEILSGRKPFSGDTTPTILYKIVNEAPDPLDLSQLQGISPLIRSVLDRALDKDPEHRHQSAEELAKALRAAKDPTWNGQAADGTVRLPSAPPTLPVPQPAAAEAVLETPQPPALPTTLVPAARNARTSTSPGLILSLAALALIAVVGGGWGAWKWKSGMAAPASPVVTTAGAEAPVQASPGRVPANTGSDLASSTIAKTSMPPATTRTTEPPRHAPAQEERPQAAPAEKEAEDELANLSGAERRNLGMGLLSDGSRIVDTDPAKALQFLKRAIAANPYDPRPYALSAAVLYQQERYDECMDVLRRARAANLTRSQLIAANARFRQAMDNDSYRHRLERALE